jgi:hypothetical protein
VAHSAKTDDGFYRPQALPFREVEQKESVPASLFIRSDGSLREREFMLVQLPQMLPTFNQNDLKPEVDNTVWYYISVVVNCIMVNAENAGCNTMRIGSIFEKFFYKYNQGGMRFEAISTSSDVEFKEKDKSSRINGSTDTTKQWNYVKLGSVLTLKVNKEFLDNFLSTDDYTDNVSNVFISYKGIACNAIRLDKEYPMDPIPHTYGSFFRGDFFNALDDIYKNKNTPYIHNISINLTNNDCNIYATYYEK